MKNLFKKDFYKHMAIFEYENEYVLNMAQKEFDNEDLKKKYNLNKTPREKEYLFDENGLTYYLLTSEEKIKNLIYPYKKEKTDEYYTYLNDQKGLKVVYIKNVTNKNISSEEFILFYYSIDNNFEFFYPKDLFATQDFSSINIDKLLLFLKK